jgi:nucleoside-diphosphate-sugar epimerase
MRILVTGAAGSVGSAVVRKLHDLGHEVVATDRIPFETALAARIVVGDLQDREIVLDALDGVDRVAHIGAIPRPGLVADSETFGSNSLSTYLVLDEAGRLGIDRAVVASSLSILGLAWGRDGRDPAYLPIDEDHPLQIEDAYALSKKAGEATAEMAHRRWGIDVVSLRFSFVAFSQESRIAHAKRLVDEPALGRRELWGWVHIDDVVDSVVAGLLADWSGCHVLNIAATDTLSATSTPELIERYLADVDLRSPLAGFDSLYDSSRAKQLIGWEAKRTWR